MKALLLAALLAGWSYGGFTEDPGDAPAPKPGPDSRPDIFPPAAKPARKHGPPPPPHAPASFPAAPRVWRLADARGQVWEHADPDWLRRWVESRNRQLAPAAPCVTGRCPR